MCSAHHTGALAPVHWHRLHRSGLFSWCNKSSHHALRVGTTLSSRRPCSLRGRRAAHGIVELVTRTARTVLPRRPCAPRRLRSRRGLLQSGVGFGHHSLRSHSVRLKARAVSRDGGIRNGRAVLTPSGSGGSAGCCRLSLPARSWLSRLVAPCCRGQHAIQQPHAKHIRIEVLKETSLK